MSEQAGEITRLSGQLQDGDERAAAELVPMIYAELHQLAASCMRRERSGQKTAVYQHFVHETWEIYRQRIGGKSETVSDPAYTIYILR